ncbi:MAG TPA: gliding motility-associated C-terminal domain-containing protein [Parafilimonas sp.]|nr:gliding motility-associated C-terminal domain-containing protein [Parafilimonas sp.]
MNHFSFLRFLFSAIILFLPYAIQAQVCNGSLGDPVVNITFGKGSSGPSNYAPPDSYTYTGSTCPNDGYYTITNATSGCFGNHWHTVTADHTGDNGNFMLVNASYDSGVFFITTVTNLCPNTTYEFSAWIMNVLNTSGIQPNLTFFIEKPDGTILGSNATGLISTTHTPEWEKYGILFTTPSDSASIVLKIVNNSPGGNGNDLALDDIAFRPCGATVTADIVGSADTVNVCEGNSTTYSFTGNASSVYQLPVYQWQLSTDTGKTWQDIQGATGTSYLRLPTATPGSYRYRFTVVDKAASGITSCRIASNLLIINVHATPVADAGPDRVYIKGYPVTIEATATGENVSYSWSPSLYLSDPASLTPVATPPVDMLYTLFVKSGFNCSNKDDMKVKAVGGLFIPNAFTPNGDGLNDYWQIPYLDIGFDADVKVFNRWGGMVYHASAARVSWDGNLNNIPQPSGAYIYLITFKDPTLPEIKGVLTLIR